MLGAQTKMNINIITQKTKNGMYRSRIYIDDTPVGLEFIDEKPELSEETACYHYLSSVSSEFTFKSPIDTLMDLMSDAPDYFKDYHRKNSQAFLRFFNKGTKNFSFKLSDTSIFAVFRPELKQSETIFKSEKVRNLLLPLTVKMPFGLTYEDKIDMLIMNCFHFGLLRQFFDLILNKPWFSSDLQ